ncbi:CPBP family glutamic-type intramembrane protease [Salinibacterium hongtaonis]|uniref:CAAX prenyl protease 2/Lysostaphin resistance protein A-like domain-containing protein n=1 Tax=Homoserinimonas hongtaonis TaxID=2079791 RepID=A0A2U1T0E2_9MICO|nr:CPBP family glutamic-type intramembrane protease [Salinibacterium hongtaonis]PWB97341.1 hypothetical protein DF220_05505 [Salinibacterium hongtaonis]
MSKFERAIAPIAIFTIVTGVVSVVLDIVQDLSGFAHGYISLAACGPAVGALTAWAVAGARSDKRASFRELLPAAVSTRQVVAHLILGVAASAVFFGLMLGALAILGVPALWPADVAGVPIAVALLGLLVGALLQEIGWRGFLQPLLELTGSRFLATVIVGAVWGFWTVQLFPMANNFVAVASVFVGTIALSVLLGYFGNGSVAQRVLAATVVHWLVASVLLLLVGAGFAPVSAFSGLAFMAAIVVTAVVFMALFVTAQRKRARRAAAAASEASAE